MSVRAERWRQRQRGHFRGLVQARAFDCCATGNRLVRTAAEQVVLLLQQLFDFSQLAKLIRTLLDRATDPLTAAVAVYAALRAEFPPLDACDLDHFFRSVARMTVEL